MPNRYSSPGGRPAEEPPEKPDIAASVLLVINKPNFAFCAVVFLQAASATLFYCGVWDFYFLSAQRISKYLIITLDRMGCKDERLLSFRTVAYRHHGGFIHAAAAFPGSGCQLCPCVC